MAEKIVLPLCDRPVERVGESMTKENKGVHLDENLVNTILENDEWRQVLEEGENFQTLMAYYECAIMEVETKFNVLNKEFSLRYDRNPIETIKSRLKSIESIVEKLQRKGLPFSVDEIEKNLTDIAGVRVICAFPEDIYLISECLLKQDDIRLIEVKDYIKNPKESGYKSYHMLVTVPIFLSDRVIDTKVEIQIRTMAMDFWASLEHKIYYKFEGNAPGYISRDLRECSDIVSMLDAKMLQLNEAIIQAKEAQEEQTGAV